MPPLASYLKKFEKRRFRKSAAFVESDRRVRSDDYIPWLCGVVGGWLAPDHGNVRAFDYAVRMMPAGGTVVEIGSFLGLSTNLVTYLMQKYQRDHQMFSCDPWVFEGTAQRIGGYFDAGSDAFRRYAKEVFRLNVALFSDARKPYAIEARSGEFFERWDRRETVTDLFGRSVALGGPISFAYIDGAHTYEAAKSDFLGVNRHLVPGGFVLFDDSDDGGCFPEVTHVAREVADDPSYELVFTTPHYFFRKRPEDRGNHSLQ